MLNKTQSLFTPRLIDDQCFSASSWQIQFIWFEKIQTMLNWYNTKKNCFEYVSCHFIRSYNRNIWIDKLYVAVILNIDLMQKYKCIAKIEIKLLIKKPIYLQWWCTLIFVQSRIKISDINPKMNETFLYHTFWSGYFKYILTSLSLNWFVYGSSNVVIDPEGN